LEAPAVFSRDAPRAKIGIELRSMIGKRVCSMNRKRAVVEKLEEEREDVLISYKGPVPNQHHCHGTPITKLHLTPAAERRLLDGVVAPKMRTVFWYA
jgi:hypothetical protein